MIKKSKINFNKFRFKPRHWYKESRWTSKIGPSKLVTWRRADKKIWKQHYEKKFIKKIDKKNKFFNINEVIWNLKTRHHNIKNFFISFKKFLNIKRRRKKNYEIISKQIKLYEILKQKNKIFNWLLNSLKKFTYNISKYYIQGFIYKFFKKKIMVYVSKYCQQVIKSAWKEFRVSNIIYKISWLSRFKKQHIESFDKIYNNLSWLIWIFKNNIIRYNGYEIIQPLLGTQTLKFLISNNTLYSKIVFGLYSRLFKAKKIKRKLYNLLRTEWNFNMKPVLKQHSVKNRFVNIYKLSTHYFLNISRRYNILSSFFFDKFKNRYMFKGQRSSITKIFNNVFMKFKLQKTLNFINIIKVLVLSIRPIFTFVYRRKSKQILSVPTPIQWYKQYKIAIKWVFWTLNSRSSRTFELKFIKEIGHILLRRRNILIRRRNIYYHNVVENRFFSYFRWK